MTDFNAMIFLPLVLLALAGYAPGAHGAVHTIDVTHHHLPSANVSRRAVPTGLPRPNLEALRRHHQAEIDYYLHGKGTLNQFDVRAIVTTQPVDVEHNGYDYIIIGNVSLGYPTQSFRLVFDPHATQLYVIDVEAQYYYYNYYNYYDGSSPEDIEGTVTDKQIYDPTASSSCVLDVNGTFVTTWGFENGSVASDELRVGDSLLTRVSFMDTSLVGDWLQQPPYDGVFGLSPTPDHSTNSTTLLSQLQSSLDSPVVTYTMAYTTTTDPNHPGSGRVILGGLAPDTCQTDWVVVVNRSDSASDMDPLTGLFHVASVSTIGEQDGCADAYSVDVPTDVYVFPYFDYIYTSDQMLELFVRASNATFNASSWQYELSVEKMAAAQPVYLNMEGGGVIRLDPDDYVAVSAETGNTYLNVYGGYDMHKYDDYSHLSLGAAFLNNHCLSMNIQTGAWSIASAVEKTEIVGTATSTEEASVYDSSSDYPRSSSSDSSD